jgi:hypothetical protein
MSHRFAFITSTIFCAVLCFSDAFGQQPVMKSHQDLNWKAPRRWVHVDNVDSQKAAIFENARKGWLTALRKDDHLLGDGRPLFWCTRRGNVQTYFTFYPFTKWAEMDARRDMIVQTNKIVGEQALKDYDSCDSVLVPPHYSQMWRRDESSDIVGLGGDSLTEVTASAGRLEIHQIDEHHWEEFDSLWKDIQTTLVAAKYPFTCRVYANMFGKSAGEIVLFWLAADTAISRSAPSIGDALIYQVGKEKGAKLVAGLDTLFPIIETFTVERRADLSNLGR